MDNSQNQQPQIPQSRTGVASQDPVQQAPPQITPSPQGQAPGQMTPASQSSQNIQPQGPTAPAQNQAQPQQAPQQTPQQQSQQQPTPDMPQDSQGNASAPPGQPRRRGDDGKDDGGKKETDYRQRSERFRKEREIIRAREVDTDMGKRLGALAVPFIFLAILTLIVVFILIPFSTEIVETRDNTRLLLDDIERNEEKIDALMGIDLTTVDRHLEVASVVVRDEMDVSEMAIEVERLALKHNLDPRSQNASNTEDLVVAASSLDTEWVPGYADVVSGPFNFAGAFEDVCGFLRDLRLNSKTILSLGQISMTEGVGVLDDDLDGTTGEGWSVTLLISGYTASPVQDVNVADPVRTDIDAAILQEMYVRAGEEYQAEVAEDEGQTASE